MIYLIRHGQTEWNVALRMQGQGDSPLTELGILQAKAVGRKLKESVYQNQFKIFSSPLGRAVKTSEIICSEMGINRESITTEMNLSEVSFGEWNGLNTEEIEKKFPGELSKRLANKWNYQIKDGETYAQASVRVKMWLDIILSEKMDIILITHDVISKLIRGSYLGLDPESILNLDKHIQNRIYLLDKYKVDYVDCKII